MQKMKFINQLQRYYHTVKYLRLRQIILRFWFLLRFPFYCRVSRLVNWLYDKKTNHVATKSTRLLKGLDNRRGGATPVNYEKTAKALLSNTFNFLNKEIRFDSQIDWQTSQASKLWRYNLHYFDYARVLSLFYQSTGCDKAYGKFKSLSLDWIERNKIGKSEGWEAYPVSLRIVNWFLALHLFSEKIITDSKFYEQLLKSLFKHALFLERNLEYHICGNHLIKNGKALVFAGLFFQGREADRWYKKGTSLLWKELQEQILADGGHFERSPMYHLIVLQDYQEIYLLLRDDNRDVPPYVEDKIKSMLDFLVKILQPDGDIPLLNDSAFGIAPHPIVLLEIGNSLLGKISEISKQTSFALDSSGYYVMRDKSDEKYLIVDCGKICPDYLPPHAHCDTLSYELSIRNERIIVDSGVYEYDSGKRRDFYRSTRAHNTVVVDGLNQSDVWGSFRAGRRAFPTEVKWIVKDDITFFEGGHDGYLKKTGVLHKRKIVFVDNGFWLIFDELDGIGRHTFEEYLHFHPEIEVTCGDAIVAQKSKRQLLQIIPVGKPETQILQGELEPIQGWYSQEFGIKEPNPVLLLRYEASLPVCIGYGLFPMPVEYFSIDSSFEEGQLNLKLNGISYRIELADNDITLQKEGNT
jgi:uncharacterized heparinase superfamily protein